MASRGGGPQTIVAAVRRGKVEQAVYQAITVACERIGRVPVRAAYDGAVSKEAVLAAQLVTADVSEADENVDFAVSRASEAKKPVVLLSRKKGDSRPGLLTYTVSKAGIIDLTAALIRRFRQALAVRAPVLCLSNQKGGVAKTTSVINLAASLAHQEKELKSLREIARDILVVDMDPQANLRSLLLDGEPGDLFANLRSGKPISDLVHPSQENKRIHVLPTQPRVETVSFSNKSVLKNALEPLRTAYDLILIDTGGNVDDPLHVAWHAADYVLVPTDLSVHSLKTLEHYIPFVKKSQREAGFEFLGLFFTMVQAASVAASKAEIQKRLQALIKEQGIPWIPKTISHHDVFPKALIAGKGAVEARSNSQARKDYEKLGVEILKVIGAGFGK